MPVEGYVLRCDLPGGRRELRLRVGSFSVVVSEIPGRSLSEDERDDIRRARGSYPAMWGGDGHDALAHDPLDGAAAPYRAWHYRAFVTGPDEPTKLVVMRKVTLAPSELTPEQRANPGDLLPLDIRFWRVRTDVGAAPLWDALRNHASRLAPDERHPELRIASMGRVAAFPFGEQQRTARERERTAIAFAATQLLAAHRDPHLLHVWSLCPELRDRVVSVRDVNDAPVRPAFTPTEELLGLPPGSVCLDNSSPVVREHKTTFPGYFLDNDDAARLIAGLLDQGRLTLADLRDPTMRLIARESAAGGDTALMDELVALVAEPDHRRLADVLTRPRLFQYLVPLLTGNRRLSRMTTADLRTLLLRDAGDGPFSATVTPAAWAASAWAVLAAAERKYGSRPPAATLPGATRRLTSRPWGTEAAAASVP
jgi:hypothetical protein